MALNFPNSPTIGQIYVDTTSGFSYEWDGTVWKSYTPTSVYEIKILDDISPSFNGSTASFSLTSNSSPITPPFAQSLIINLGGVVQDPSDDYSISGSTITFSTPPASGLSFSGISLGNAFPVTLTNLSSTDDTTTNGTLYPVFVGGTLNEPTKISTSKLTYEPNVGKLTATTFSGQVNAGIVTCTTLSNASLLNYSEPFVNTGNTGSATTLGLSTSGYFISTLNQSTTFTFNSSGISTQYFGFAIQLKNGTGGPFSITWPASVYWPDGGATPSRTAIDGRTDIWSFTTTDGGTTWLGNLSILNYTV